MKIAYFGTGLLGAGFVRHLLELGHEMNVWNRSARKAHALEPDGAKAFALPADAVRGVEQLHFLFGVRATRLAASMGAAGLRLRHRRVGGGEGQLAPGPWVK